MSPWSMCRTAAVGSSFAVVAHFADQERLLHKPSEFYAQRLRVINDKHCPVASGAMIAAPKKWLISRTCARERTWALAAEGVLDRLVVLVEQSYNLVAK